MPVLNKHFFTMKKLFLAGVFALATLTSCQNETNEIPTPANYEAKANLKINSRENTSSQRLYVVSASEVYLDEDRLIEQKGEEVDIVNSTILNHNSRKRDASIQCDYMLPSGIHVYLVHVHGGNAPSTYWMSFVEADGSIHTYSNPGLSCNDLRDIIN